MFGHQDDVNIPLQTPSPPALTPAIQDQNQPAASQVPSMQDMEDLLSIKRQALQQLSPLVSHLDQSPEEKFHTIMMMIQASDNQSLIKAAHETAEKITNEKVKAQALLDLVNEINYFTQKPAA